MRVFHLLPMVEMQRAESSGHVAVLGVGSERGSPGRG